MHEHMCASVLVVLLDGKFFIFLFVHIIIQDYKMCTYIWNFKSMISVYRQFIHLKHLFKLKTDKIQTLLLVPLFLPFFLSP